MMLGQQKRCLFIIQWLLLLHSNCISSAGWAESLIQRALCVLERALPTEAAQLAGLNHSYRARQSTLCSGECSTN